MTASLKSLAAFLALAVALAGCSRSTPQSVFEKAKTSAEKQDYSAFLSCFSKESQEGLLASSMMGAAFASMKKDSFKEDPDKKKELEGILKKHGIETAEGKKMTMEQVLKDVKDRPGLYAALMGFVEKHTQKDKEPKKGTKLDGELKDVKIEGTTATATLHSKTKEGKDKQDVIDFIQVDGQWYLHVDKEKDKARREKREKERKEKK